jgi:hypothetical protein
MDRLTTIHSVCQTDWLGSRRNRLSASWSHTGVGTVVRGAAGGLVRLDAIYRPRGLAVWPALISQALGKGGVVSIYWFSCATWIG